LDALGLASLVLASVFTGILTLLGWRLVRTGRPSLDAALLGFLWVFVATLDLLLHGLAGALTRTALAATSLVGGAALVAFPPARSAIGASIQAVRSFGSPLRMAWEELPGWLRILSIAFLGLGALRFVFLIWALPPFVWDSLTYHLTNVAHWIQTGRIEVFETPVLRIYSPANYEVLATWFAVFSHHDGWIEASGLPAYGIAAAATYAIGRRLALSRTGSWIAALGMASTPALVLAATGTKNDPLVAAVFLCIVALVVDAAQDAAQAIDGPTGPRALALFLLTLYGIGTKPYLVYLLPGAGLTGLILAGARPSLNYFRALPTRMLRALRNM